MGRGAVRLTTSAGAELENPSAQDIAQAIGAVPLDPAFDAVISIDQDHFLQARTDPGLEPEGEGIALAGLDGGKHLFESKTRHPLEMVVRVFQLYAAGNPQWKQEIAWNEFTGGIGSRVLILGAVVVGVFLLFQFVSKVLFGPRP